MLDRLLCAIAAVALTGCAASTQLVTNEKASDAVKARSFKSYREVILVPPKEDPRHLVDRVAHDIGALGFQVTVLPPGQAAEASQGTGFVIGHGGWLITCAHVVGEKTNATVTLNGQRLMADVVKSDKVADLALLRIPSGLPDGAAVLSFRDPGQPAEMGEDVSTIGYPLSRLLGNHARLTKGSLSATSGLHDDDKQVQVSAEIQPGNSGGPLFDHDGRVIGVVDQTLNPTVVAQATGGALPQNVNFAIKAGPVLDFVRAASDEAAAGIERDAGLKLDLAAKAVAKVQAGEVAPDADRHDKMVVRMAYLSRWDIWWRFRMFLLAAYDDQTQEPLFLVGQGHDNMVSNEDVVIHDTMEQFKKAVSAR